MSLSRPLRRVLVSVPLHVRPSTLTPPPSASLLASHHSQQRRSKSRWSLSSLNPFRRDKDSTTASSTVSKPEDLDNPAARNKFISDAMNPKVKGSIFEEEVAQAKGSESGGDVEGGQEGPAPLDPSSLLAVTDPDPRSRTRWERKMVIRSIRRNGLETRDQVIARTEREMHYKSPFFPTSTKKLVHLAHQIAGKPIEEAILQMTYSKKKMAREVKFQLEKARDLAVVTHGMGLDPKDTFTPRTIVDREKKVRRIHDPSQIYVSQAWVGRGERHVVRIVRLGRGRRGPNYAHQASISFVLKEEKSRIRDYDERKAKEADQKPWVHLPHRRVTAQRQYYSW